MAPRAATLFALALLATTPAAAAGWELRVCADPDNLPFSDRAGEGFDNKIAAILAEEMEADPSDVGLPELTGSRQAKAPWCCSLSLEMSVKSGYRSSPLFCKAEVNVSARATRFSSCTISIVLPRFR